MLFYFVALPLTDDNDRYSLCDIVILFLLLLHYIVLY